MKLGLYNKRRNFKKTNEPQGRISHQDNNLFVVQKHAASHLHYDFRIELNGVLLSWAVPKGPCLDPTVKRLAIHVEDHPVEYGHFEGTIPQGEYGGGTVMLWDKGTWAPEDDAPGVAYQKGHLRFQLNAQKLKGKWNLIRLKKGDDKSWFLIKGKDRYAKPLSAYDITTAKPKSVVSHLDLGEIAEQQHAIWHSKPSRGSQKPKKNAKVSSSKIKIDLPAGPFPTVVSPQLAYLVAQAPVGIEWLHEIKFDGYRILSFKKNKQIKLISRYHHEWTHFFKNIVQALHGLPCKNIILDGEIVLLDKNQKSNFQLLQNAAHAQKNAPFIYYIFDILYYDRYNLMPLPLIKRKKILHSILSHADQKVLRYSAHIIGSGPQIFAKSCEMSLEGIISKNINSPYVEKRSKNWLKVKCLQRQAFIVGGFSPPKGARRYFGALYLGQFDKNKNLIYCGQVGTGFNQTVMKGLYQTFKKNIIKKNPFSAQPPGSTSATWVKPMMVVEVEFIEWTEDGRLRHPSFKGVKGASTKRPNKEKKITVAKKTAPPGRAAQSAPAIILSHPHKIMYPEAKITKLDIANYYEEIHPWILPYIINRPLTIVRCPENYKKCFYQKHINQSTPDTLYGATIKEKDKVEKTIYIKDQNGLRSLVQMGTLEIHTWGSRIGKIDVPDLMVIDIDPAPGIAWKKIVLAAQRVRKYLATFKLKSFVKTTGGKGLHVVVPLQPHYHWPQVKQFTHVLAEWMVVNYPGEYVSQMSKQKRRGKIFIDYLRNQRGATAICPYSTRARPGAPVAVPLFWDELTQQRKDTDFTIKTLPQRLRNLQKCPWEDFFKIKQSLKLK